MDRSVVEDSFLMTGRKTKIIIAILSFIIIVGLYNYVLQLRKGLAVTGLSDKIFWGVYITNFIFFIGISHAGTLISAILRLTETGWRTPITRLAEMITLIALILGASSILIDMGQIWRIGNMLGSPNIRSPLIWDLIAILLYLLGSLIFFYLPLIPDAAYYAGRVPKHYRFRKKLYTWIARGWTGDDEQKEILRGNIKRMSIVIIPVMISVHTIIAWIMSMTSRVGWDSTIFGPYFVVGAIYSGIATVLMAMVLFTVFYKLEDYITKEHFISLSKIFLIINLTYAYFTISEYLTVGYKSQISGIALLEEIFYGHFSGFFWFFIIFGLIIPSILLIMLINKKKNITDHMTKLIVFATALLVNMSMWIKRYLITVPTLSQEGDNTGWYTYLPTSVEIWITLAQFSAFILFFIVLSKIFPIISLWEVEEGE